MRALILWKIDFNGGTRAFDFRLFVEFFPEWATKCGAEAEHCRAISLRWNGYLANQVSLSALMFT